MKAEGLGSGERVTLRVSGVRHRGCLFHSLVPYEVDSGEGLALARDLALGGDFTGVGPMGLLWSLMPAASKDPCLSRMPRAALKNPLKVEDLYRKALGTLSPRAAKGQPATAGREDPGGRHAVPQCPARTTLRAERKDRCRAWGFGGERREVRTRTDPAGPSNQSSDSSNRRNGEYLSGRVAKAERRLGVEKGDCGVLRVWGSLNSGREPEEKTGQRPSEAKEIKLYAQIPPVEKMDASLSMLANCEKLSLSTNCIEKIANLNGLKNLRILSLGRNNIKNLNGLEAVGDTLEELWISYNFIEKLKGIHVMKKLKILYMSNNLVKDWGNPLEEKHSAENNWIEEATKRVPKLKKLDVRTLSMNKNYSLTKI
ncbi:hypothetical protein H8959_016980 [Pygathrix nigripes]